MSVKKKILFNIIYIAAVVGIVFVVWAIAAAVIDSEFVLPGIPETFSALGTVLAGVEFWTGLGGTLLRCVIGYVISAALAFLLFCLCTAFEGAARVFDPLISALRSLPAVAVTLILILLVGGRGAPVVLGVLVIMPIMYSGARASVATVPQELAEVCDMYGAGKLKRLRVLWLPKLNSALPDVLSSAFSYNIKTVIGAEILAQTAKSLGMLMKFSQMYLQTSMLIAYVVTAVVISVLAELIIKYVLKLILKKSVA